MPPKINALVLAALLLVPLPTAPQQGQSAVLVGVVRDQSGALVRGASVEASSASLVGGSLQAETDDTGAYRLAFLPATHWPR